jgi:hypothetical protein
MIFKNKMKSLKIWIASNQIKDALINQLDHPQMVPGKTLTQHAKNHAINTFKIKLFHKIEC